MRTENSCIQVGLLPEAVPIHESVSEIFRNNLVGTLGNVVRSEGDHGQLLITQQLDFATAVVVQGTSSVTRRPQIGLIH